MKRALAVVLLLGVALGIGIGGYWLGRRQITATPQRTAIAATKAANTPPSGTTPERAILYYRDPMGKPNYSPVPKKDSMGMDYVPVYEGQEDNAPPSSASPPPASKPKGKVLYYRNPMGLADTSPVPKKDSMGMEYIPVLEGEDADDADTVSISPTRVQTLLYQLTTSDLPNLDRTGEEVGRVKPDERRLFIINTNFEGWIEKL